MRPRRRRTGRPRAACRRGCSGGRPRGAARRRARRRPRSARCRDAGCRGPPRRSRRAGLRSPWPPTLPSAAMRVLALADEPARADPARLVADNRPDLVVTLGDLEPEWLAPLARTGVPVLGVHGNHDAEGQLETLGIRDLHLARAEVGGVTFTGFEGCVRYGNGGPHQYTQDEAARLLRLLPRADVLLTHAPPLGVNDEPDDRAHTGFTALRAWVERHRPRLLLHGHTTPDPRRRTSRLGDTKVVWVRGARMVELP